jgi:hypothetical protein
MRHTSTLLCNNFNIDVEAWIKTQVHAHKNWSAQWMFIVLNIVDLLCIMTTYNHLHLWVIVHNKHLVEGFNFQQNDAFKLVVHNEYSLPSFSFSICCIQLSYKNLVLGSMLKHWAQWVGTNQTSMQLNNDDWTFEFNEHKSQTTLHMIFQNYRLLHRIHY